MLGYATIFTTFPVRVLPRRAGPRARCSEGVSVGSAVCARLRAQVFSLVLDEDVSETNALKFPELYRELQKRVRAIANQRVEVHAELHAL